ncbi:MAG: UDP-N-acetylenolpyruvoylglucosamine reductase [Candidatus Yonathbacteria bacterium RIFOXYC1_FULL_52_10]|uniref:UDP-N-acetylenolpyruvoylglucosamine reductase n=1 Tax=Candidatus Yonathbacteria bacterium RIFOXYD1_FULL_52_36 TaxID=1802730 RepID=A0A1G2SLS7_9BACT|nr:MAG: UDP-N-acetylenolpyruvoylglucosamine reductase [Candidatus Yonathbacteria bacterium RIFOXYC1_FULL_52_10]OHA85904.1 MAG: UDP-N-acetylenolpyruvoylglucosamine reductase [Candidatus Yonathbacteria bacterium RIFOXYD1_FULL_52_36]
MAQEFVPLAPKTTMRTGGSARYFFSVSSEEDVVEAVRFAEDNDLPIFVLGDGSNVVISDEGFLGVVLEMKISGVSFEEREDGVVVVEAGAGVRWDDLVHETVLRSLWGLENLSCIPGTVGAAPVQNIGAYGAEAKDRIVSVRAYDTHEHRFVEMDPTRCGFGYRTSIFKNEGRGRFVVTRVSWGLSRTSQQNLSYRDLEEHFKGSDHASITSREIRTAVCAIREQKLPDPNVLCNTGSFFKNPTVSQTTYQNLVAQFPQIVGREIQNGIKISAAQLIDACGWKGKRSGDAGVYEQHALVIVNHGNASSHDVISLSQKIIDDVYARTTILLEREVEII